MIASYAFTHCTAAHVALLSGRAELRLDVWDSDDTGALSVVISPRCAQQRRGSYFCTRADGC